ncbi:MAG TPA: Alw26I/Eco31I/Esp3I family type II restriction endonuclease, partial [Chlamydiales bacterium]|nr:Alw26I/Eco31I/Esp3I family type II restriction endonuclease [Chlamydiales bacterium]
MTKKLIKEKIGGEIIDDPSRYGSKRQTWAAEFVIYMKTIVTHPAYDGMPDAVKNDGMIQWEAPSNRSSGLYQFTHIKRRNWWKNKAESIGIDTSKDRWISQAAKKIHPTGEKPCKRCGRIMKIAYVYPKANLINRLKNQFGKDFEISITDTIIDILKGSYNIFGNRLIECISELLATGSLKIPNFNKNFDSLIDWVIHEYIPKEPSTLSPGVMSNAPDRFDGFHSFNRCCRGKADTGRHAANLSSYTTDRRVFEFWSEGDWIAADRLAGLVKSKLSGEPCADGGDSHPTADHIGPLSLGFCHRPEFKLLSKSANSAKNNRMSLSDVRYLLDCENRGIQVISWYAKPL